MQKIQLLDQQTIDQIAAGEVIENSASVVKEVVENAIDAGATEIVISMTGGGRQSLRIEDNGCGMSCEDALLSLKRHATSKIQTAAQIETLQTMGFRGEALASIAAVSRLSLHTAFGPSGTLVKMEGGNLVYQRAAPRGRGTTVEVRDLFYNVPARRKFQKSTAYDENEILKVMTQLALGHTHISFQLISDGKVKLHAPLSNNPDPLERLKVRIADVQGESVLETYQPFSWEKEGVRLSGFLGTPCWTRQNRSGQILFIKKRVVVSTLVSCAVLEGYGTLIAPRRFPNFVLHLDLPGDWLDVNVHPQKKEVRLRKEQWLRQTLAEAVGSAFQTPLENLPWERDLAMPFVAEERIVAYQPQPLPFPRKNEELPVLPALQPLLHLIGLWHHYILLDAATMPSNAAPGIVFVDSRRAHLRVLFERFKKEPEESASCKQSLLLPETLQFSKTDAALLVHHLESFSKMGFELRSFGKDAFILEAIPSDFERGEGAIVIREMLDRLGHKETVALPSKDRIAAAAALAAVGRRRMLGEGEARRLIADLFACDSSDLCPFGQPIYKRFLPEELVKRLDI